MLLRVQKFVLLFHLLTKNQLKAAFGQLFIDNLHCSILFRNMIKINAIVVDDEASARENLTLLLRRFCPQVNVVQSFSLLEPAVEYLRVNPIDVVFLDVEMPEHTGFEIVDYFSEIEFDIVFCTAYDQYAIKAFEVSAIDYLLKPIDITRLKQAVQKLAEKQSFNLSKAQINQINSSFKNTLKVIDKGEKILLQKAEVIAIEAQSAYSTVYTNTQAFTVSKNIAQLEQELANDKFFYRTQKSWIVNLNCVQKVNKANRTISLFNGIEAKISRQKAKDFYDLVSL